MFSLIENYFEGNDKITGKKTVKSPKLKNVLKKLNSMRKNLTKKNNKSIKIQQFIKRQIEKKYYRTC